MRSLLTTSITLIFLIAHPAMGVTVTPFSTTDQKRRVFSIVDKNYEDTRIDFDGDKSIDYWRIKKDNLLIETYFAEKRTVYHIRFFHTSSVDERILFSETDDLYLYKSQARRQFIFNFTTQGPLCVGNHKTEWQKLEASLKEISDRSLDKSVETFIDSQCFDTLDTPVYETLADNIKSIFSIPSQKPNALLDCLQGAGVKKLFVEKFGDKEGPLNHEKAIIGFKNSIVKFSNLKQGDESILSCKKVEGENPKNPMKVTESGLKIQFLFGSKVDTSKIKEQLFHESIHISSVADESLSQNITDLCVNNKSVITRIALAKSHASAFSSTTTALDVLKGEQEVAKTESQKIPKSVAETPLNPTKDKSPVDMNRMADAAGTATVAEVSKAQTSGVVRMAESVLGSTPAVAAEPSTSLASSSSTASGSGPSSSGSSSSSSSSYASSPSYSASSTSSSDDSRPARRASDSSRSPASEYQLDMSTVGAKAPTVKVVASANGDSLGKGEYIKEEVDLTKPAVTTSSSVGRVPASTKTVSSDVSASASSQTNNTEQASSSGGGNYGAAGRGASSASLGSGSQSSNGSTSSSPQRRGTSSQTAGGSYVPSRDEVVSFFSGGSYQQARGKLKDQGFVQTLKQNNITVYDLGGNTYGASKGEIIFVDQGDRFVRQK